MFRPPPAPPTQPLSAELAAMAALLSAAEAQHPGAYPMAATLAGYLSIAANRALILEFDLHQQRAAADAFHAIQRPALAAAEAAGQLLHFRRPRTLPHAPRGGHAA